MSCLLFNFNILCIHHCQYFKQLELPNPPSSPFTSHVGVTLPSKWGLGEYLVPPLPSSTAHAFTQSILCVVLAWNILVLWSKIDHIPPWIPKHNIQRRILTKIESLKVKLWSYNEIFNKLLLVHPILSYEKNDNIASLQIFPTIHVDLLENLLLYNYFQLFM